MLANIGRVLESHELQEASGGAAEFARRIRELREDEDWPILTHNDMQDLKPGQYLLKEVPPAKSSVRFSRSISTKLRAQEWIHLPNVRAHTRRDRSANRP